MSFHEIPLPPGKFSQLFSPLPSLMEHQWIKGIAEAMNGAIRCDKYHNKTIAQSVGL